jgi:phage-related protein
MEIYGPNLGMPPTRAMGEGLFELRLKAAEGIARVFYCTLIGRRIVMLHQFVKKSDNTPRKELDIARR